MFTEGKISFRNNIFHKKLPEKLSEKGKRRLSVLIAVDNGPYIAVDSHIACFYAHGIDMEVFSLNNHFAESSIKADTFFVKAVHIGNTRNSKNFSVLHNNIMVLFLEFFLNHIKNILSVKKLCSKLYFRIGKNITCSGKYLKFKILTYFTLQIMPKNFFKKCLQLEIVCVIIIKILIEKISM